MLISRLGRWAMIPPHFAWFKREGLAETDRRASNEIFGHRRFTVAEAETPQPSSRAMLGSQWDFLNRRHHKERQMKDQDQVTLRKSRNLPNRRRALPRKQAFALSVVALLG